MKNQVATRNTQTLVEAIPPSPQMDAAGRINYYHILSKQAGEVAIKAALAKMEELADDRLDYSGKVYISQSDCMDDAKELARQVEETFHKLPEPLLINNIGTTIGAHTGPGTVALFFWGDERVD